MRTILFLIVIPVSLIAQSRDYFIYPVPLAPNDFISTVGLSLAELPEDQVEEVSTAIRAPLFNFQARYGLPENFSLYGAFYTNFATYHFSLGPRWKYRIDRLSFYLGYDVAFWFGALNQFGYDSKVNAWMHYPNFSLGYEFNKFAVTIKAELIYQVDLTVKSEDVEVSTEYNKFVGTAIGAYIEQPLWKDNIVILGIKVNYTKYYYPIWAAFPTFDRYFYIPEIVIGLNL